MNMTKALIFGIAVISVVSHAAPLSAQQYARYCNERYGFCVSYPTRLGLEPPPANNDGRSFYDGNGFVMTVSGINNILEDTLQSEMRSQSEGFDKITYRATGENWFILSGYKGPNILYIKTYVGKGSANHLHIKYPACLKVDYDEIVTKVSRSFMPGRIKDSN